MTEILLLLLKPALICVSNPKKYWYLAPIAVTAWIVDVILCHTSWALLVGWPKDGEVTISDTLERLCFDFDHPQNLLCIQIALSINRIDPNHNHIKAVAII